MYSYDVHGNVIEKVDADGRVQYTYDSRQQLTRVDFPDGTSVSYAYDAFGRRVMRDETYWHNNGRLRSDVVHYLYDGLEVLKEYGGTPGEGRPPLAEYWRANGRVVARRLYGNPTRPGPGNDDFLFTRGGLLYYHYDALGTVQALTDRQGDVIAQYYYDVFGQPWAGPLGPYNAYGLTGKEYDHKTGLYYFGARWYEPQVGRWITQDPARDGMNWYVYVHNNPLRFIDPYGLCSQPADMQPGQVGICFNTFIPDPEAEFAGRYAGDDRGFEGDAEYKDKSYRTAQWVVVDFSEQSARHTTDVGITKNLNTGKAAQSSGNTLKMDAEWNEDSVTIRLRGNEGHPQLPAPGITYDITVVMTPDSVSGQISHDGYPAYELYSYGYLEEPFRHYDYHPDDGRSPLSLFPPMNERGKELKPLPY